MIADIMATAMTRTLQSESWPSLTILYLASCHVFIGLPHAYSYDPLS